MFRARNCPSLGEYETTFQRFVLILECKKNVRKFDQMRKSWVNNIKHYVNHISPKLLGGVGEWDGLLKHMI